MTARLSAVRYELRGNVHILHIASHEKEDELNMTETMTRQIPSINAVDGFNPAEFTRALPNEDGTSSLYLDVKYRLLWFRLHRPNGKIEPEILHIDDKSAVVCCKLYQDRSDPADQYVAKSCAQRFLTQDKFGDRFLEVAETAAIGRVLAAAGYGTQFCGSTDMLSDIIADAPIDLNVPDDDTVSALAGGHVTHQLKPVKATNPPAPPAPVAPPKPKLETLEDYLNSMSLEDAKNVMVDVGIYSGQTLGQIVMRKPGDLEWYVKYYAGKNLALKAGAMLLLEAATSKAS